MPTIVLYSTSVPVTIKLKHDILKIKRLLDGRKCQYEEVDVAVDVDRRNEMVADESGQKQLPQLHIDGKVNILSTYIGDAEYVSELEDFGELDDILKGIKDVDSFT